MQIYLNNESKQYARIIFETLKIFLPNLTWDELINNPNPSNKGIGIDISNNFMTLTFEEKIIIKEPLNNKYDQNELKRTIRVGVYKLLEIILDNKGSPWGILTGIRPTKIVHRFWDKGKGEEEIKNILKEKFLVREDKVKKLINITKFQRKYLLNREEAKKMVSIYISIPFCPSKCYYCSFPSFSMSSYNKIKDYLEALIKEIKETGLELKKQGIKVQTIYVGGGTPTTLNPGDLTKLLIYINKYLCSEKTLEFTFEAGRPDSIDEEKLWTLRNLGVERISINPQTMWSPSLEKIGRKHTVKDVEQKMELARKMDFRVINMDLIIGLPGENLEIFKYTLDRIEKFNPENLTIHTLAIKRTAKLSQSTEGLPSQQETEKMFIYADEWTKNMGYKPYYLYRQKQILGNLENIGYCHYDKPCIYNIQMMEERQTILGLGVGAGSKIVNPQDWTLKNIYNPKDLLIYLNRINEIINAKVDKIKALS